jgi:hypothetical protein
LFASADLCLAFSASLSSHAMNLWGYIKRNGMLTCTDEEPKTLALTTEQQEKLKQTFGVMNEKEPSEVTDEKEPSDATIYAMDQDGAVHEKPVQDYMVKLLICLVMIGTVILDASAKCMLMAPTYKQWCEERNFPAPKAAKPDIIVCSKEDLDKYKQKREKKVTQQWTYGMVRAFLEFKKAFEVNKTTKKRNRVFHCFKRKSGETPKLSESLKYCLGQCVERVIGKIHQAFLVCMCFVCGIAYFVYSLLLFHCFACVKDNKDYIQQWCCASDGYSVYIILCKWDRKKDASRNRYFPTVTLYPADELSGDLLHVSINSRALQSVNWLVNQCDTTVYD